jgi:UDP-GlcNAc:undecaprenyl-phosphate/decaprenyl-phosphate GlcNAc-1-phosphate transferase
VPLAVGFVFALGVTPLARRLALRTGNIDNPRGLKIHRLPTPLMGGVAVYVAFACTAALLLPPSRPLAGVLLGGLAAVVVGVIDELVDLSVPLHAAGQIGAALLGILTGLGVVQSLSVPFEGLTGPGFHIPAFVGLIFTVIWLVGMMNAMNFLDGLDGLVTGVAILAAILLAVWASEPNRFDLPAAHRQDLLLPLALAGALLGFLPYNWHVARIFLGDSGSMFVGFAIGALAIVGPAKLGTALLVLLIPVLDVAWAVVRRRLSGRSFLAGDKQHVYHRMLDLKVGYRTTVLILYSLCLALAGLDLLFVKMAKLVAFLVLTLAIAGAFVLLEIRASRRAQPDPRPGPAALNARTPR